MSTSEETVENTAEQIAVDATKHWKKYYAEIAQDRMKEVSKLASKDEFTISIFNEKTDEYEDKTYKYREIPTKRWLELEQLRSEYADLEKLAGFTVANIVGDKTKQLQKYDFTRRLSDMLANLYRLSAKYFLKMTDDEFDGASWIDIKTIIDACNHRTIFTLPN
jgi:hypothetical protein